MIDKLVDDLQTRKILRDLWGNKTRTTLAILTIAIGVFAVGSIARAWVILSDNLSRNYTAASPASATIATERPFDEKLVKNIRRMPEIREAEGRGDLTVRVKVGPDRWYPLRLIARADYEHLSLDKIGLETGPWPPPRRSMLLERSSLPLIQLEVGDTAIIQLPDGKQEVITLAGVVHDLTQTPSGFTNVAYGYVTGPTLRKLSGVTEYSILDIIVTDNPLNKGHIQEVVEQVTAKLEAEGITVASKEIPEPGKHQLDDIIQSVLRLLAILALLAIFLCTFLVVNTISTLLAQQVQQIGAIKAIGGRSHGIILMYLKAIVILGVLALVTAIPLGMVMAQLNAIFVARLINFEITSFYIPPQIYALELSAGLVIPCLATLYPVISGARITVREAIQRSGSQGDRFGTGGFESFLNRLGNLPPVLLYAFRNIFRRKMRLALAMLTLSVAGSIFISVVSVRASLMVTIDEIAAYWQEDIMLGFYQNQRLSRLERVALLTPGITGVEGRLVHTGFRVRPDGRESSQQLHLFGVQPTTHLLRPSLLQGRWLQPDDQGSAVVNVDLLELEPDLALGDEITIRTGERRTTWKIVGFATSQVIGGGELLKAPIAYANYAPMAQAFGQVGLVNRLLVETQAQDTPTQGQVMKHLETTFNSANTRVSFSLLNVDLQTALENAFSIILNLIQVMSLLFAVVGGLGLMSMMSLNVMERTREIGVIRVVGGIRKVVFQIVVVESIFVGLLSWLAGAFLAFPMSKLLSHTLGITMLRTPLIHIFPLSGLLIWLAVILVLASAASIIPARNAARLSVRETLAYE